MWVNFSGRCYNVSGYLRVAAWEVISHLPLPWFARKRIVNMFAKRNVLHDFVLSDHVARNGFVSSGWFIFVNW